MIIGLIGMSGVGKSTWAARLAGAGFVHHDCDALIARRLAKWTGRTEATVDELGAWMGYPYEPGFAEREAAYLAAEATVLREIVDHLANLPHARRHVIDMSGSAIYVDPPILVDLRQIATIVYLEAAPDRRAALLAAYTRTPRPVIWRDHYRPHPGEEPAGALTRCYPHLIASREAHYRSFSHLTLPDQIHHDPALNVDGFLAHLQKVAAQ